MPYDEESKNAPAETKEQQRIDELEQQLAAIKRSRAYRLSARMYHLKKRFFEGSEGDRSKRVLPTAPGPHGAGGPSHIPFLSSGSSIDMSELTLLEQYNQRFSVAGLESLQVRIETIGDSEVPRTGLVSFRFYDREEREILPPGAHAINPLIGEYHYLDTSLQPRTTEFTLVFPEETHSVEIVGRQWKKGYKTAVLNVEVGQVVPEEAGIPEVSSEEEFYNAVARLGQVLIIYSTSPTMGHSTLALRPNRIAREAAAEGLPVIYLPFGRVETHEERPDSLILQKERNQLMPIIERLRDLDVARVVFQCSSFPDIHATAAIQLSKWLGWVTSYEARDDMEEFNRVGYSKWYSPVLEMRVAKAAKSVSAVSPRLAKKLKIIANREDVKVVPNGVTRELIDMARGLRTLEASRIREGRKVIGYIGHLTPSWFDWNALISAAQRLPEYEFEVIGHGAPEQIELPPNVLLLGPKTHAECLEHATRWRIGLIPFLPSTLTAAVDPNKLYEYLAFGLRTVSIRMGSVDTAPSTFVYDDSDGISQAIQRALEGAVTQEELDRLEEYVAQSTWNARFKDFVEMVGLS